MGTVVRYAGAGGVGFAIDDAALPGRAEALEKLSEPVGSVQGAAVRQAFSNDPFEDYPRVIVGYKRLFEGEERDKACAGAAYNQAVEGFLRRTFHSLTFVPEISFDTTNISESAERKALNSALVRYRSAKMERQARLLKNTYDGLRDDIATKEWEEIPWTLETRKVDPFLFGFLREVPE